MKETLAPTTLKIIDFVRSVGIPVSLDTISTPSFLPGILIRGGALVVDPEKLLFPGDLLHEAGHIAVALPENREQMNGDIGATSTKNISDGEEMMAIAWSYAACLHLQLDPAIVFHQEGYKGASGWYLEQYASGNMLYLPLLQWAGFCYDTVQAQQHNVAPFPNMLRWMRQP